MAAIALEATGAELRTLFHTPEERARLDRLRRGEPELAAVVRGRTNAITGFVKRSDGRNTVWIDGVAVPQDATAGSSALDPRNVRDATRAPDLPPLEIKRTR